MDTASHFNLIDVVAGLFVLWGFVQGLQRGLSGELARLMGTILSVWGGWVLYRPLGNQIFLSTRLAERESHALAFLIALGGVFLFMWLIRLVLRSIMEFTFKGKLERTGGGVCGTLRMAAMVMAVIFLIGLWPHDYLQRLFVEDCFVGRTMNRYLPVAYNQLSQRYPQLPSLQKNEGETEASKKTGEGSGE